MVSLSLASSSPPARDCTPDTRDELNSNRSRKTTILVVSKSLNFSPRLGVERLARLTAEGTGTGAATVDKTAENRMKDVDKIIVEC